MTIRVRNQEELEALQQRCGPLVTVNTAREIAAVSRQRIYELMSVGKFTRVLVFGSTELIYREVVFWCASDREKFSPDWVLERLDNPQHLKASGL